MILEVLLPHFDVADFLFTLKRSRASLLLFISASVQQYFPVFPRYTFAGRLTNVNSHLFSLKFGIPFSKDLIAPLQHNIDLEVFDHHDIEYGELLGKGGEGIVQQCTVIYNGMPIDAAVKTLQDNSDDAISITLDEIELLW